MRDSKDDFYCPLCGCRLLWFPVSHIFLCESCEQSFNEKAEAYLRHKTKSPVGNAAAMREAMLEIETVAGEAVENGTMELPQYSKIVDIAESALSAPPRNCDVEYADQVEMYDAFKDWCKAKGHTMEPMLAYDAFDWLLAPAAERKEERDE